ncbi:MAG TPA: phospho-N-acetylmuramoyl-pentapeptide-transferase [Firmicutes bacterium]|nr:phospho-N-acetylmuramoyl-pentapeptide-transferase [Candidatus Fermentithermobacillaceae bacterium]
MELLFDAVSLGAGFLSAVLLGKVLIPWLYRVKFGQPIREDAPETHRKKAGTPTMGGFIFILGTIAAVLVSNIIRKAHPSGLEISVLALYGLMGIVGFLDDYRKIKRGRNLGLRAREKMALQVLIAAGFMWFVASQGRGTYVVIPFTGKTLDLGFLYGVFGVFVIVGISNGVNLTDGLDGLAGSVVAEGLAAYYPVALAAADALGIPSLGPLVAGSVGAILGFLVYNRHPARVIMGDIGALALGALLSGVAILTRSELLLVFFAFIPVVENITVIMQVISFQLFGKRIFKMTPIHHHFELSGWHEVRIVRMFRWVALAAALVGLFAAASVGLWI